MKIKLHSITDLITNSSTVIYTYSEASEQALKDMITSIFKAFNIDKKCDDVFKLVVTMEDTYDYSDKIAELEEPIAELEGLKDDASYQKIEDTLKDVLSGKIEKPQWMKQIEQQNEGYNGYRISTTLNIIPLKPEYAEMAKLVGKFLYSTDHEATRDG